MAKAKIRNVSGEARNVADLGWRLVDVDEVITVPDPERYTCQPGIWAAEEPAATAPAAESKDGE